MGWINQLCHSICWQNWNRERPVWKIPAYPSGGKAVSADAYGSLRETLATQLPAGLELNAVDLAPPVAAPFLWGAVFEAGAVTLSGHVPSEQARDAVATGAKELFGAAAVLDRMEFASGAPEKWTQVVLTALEQLSRLQSGKANLSDTELTFQGQAADAQTASDVAAKVRLGLPAVYKSSETVTYEQAAAPDATPSNPGNGKGEALRANNRGRSEKAAAAPM